MFDRDMNEEVEVEPEGVEAGSEKGEEDSVNAEVRLG